MTTTNSTMVLTPRDVANAELSIDQVTIVTEFAELIRDHAQSRDTFAADASSFVQSLFPSPAPWPAWKAAKAYLAFEADRIGVNQEYAMQCLRVAYKSAYGELPTASGVNGKSAGKGKSAKRAMNGVLGAVEALADRLKRDRSVIDGARMAKIAKLVASLALEVKAELKDLAA